MTNMEVLKANFQEDEKISLSTLSELTGFPLKFIKKELLLEDEALSMDDLRKSMMIYLQSTLNKSLKS